MFGLQQLADLQRDLNVPISKFFDLVLSKHGASASHKKVKQFYEEIHKDHDKLKEIYKAPKRDRTTKKRLIFSL